MGLKDDIIKQVNKYTKGNYDITNTRSIPSAKDLGFGNKGRIIRAPILYADLRRSSEVTERHRRQTTAKIFKSFLYAMAQIARSRGGEIRSFDGDRIMVIFPPTRGDQKAACNRSVRTGMEMAWFFNDILRPKLSGYNDSLDCGIGIAFSEMLVVRVGLKRQPYNNDIVLIGRAANLAAKLSDKGRKPNYLWIDHETYKRLDKESIQNVQTGRRLSKQPIWKPRDFKFAGKQLKVFSSKQLRSFS